MGMGSAGPLKRFYSHTITTRWVLRERRAQWLVRTIPDHPCQHVYYQRSGLGWRILIEDHKTQNVSQ